jgi:hypothetical protein
MLIIITIKKGEDAIVYLSGKYEGTTEEKNGIEHTFSGNMIRKSKEIILADEESAPAVFGNKTQDFCDQVYRAMEKVCSFKKMKIESKELFRLIERIHIYSNEFPHSEAVKKFQKRELQFA